MGKRRVSIVRGIVKTNSVSRGTHKVQVEAAPLDDELFGAVLWREDALELDVWWADLRVTRCERMSRGP